MTLISGDYIAVDPYVMDDMDLFDLEYQDELDAMKELENEDKQYGTVWNFMSL